ncbi:response regulator transcription factor [Tropicimonas sp. S265A]|uniref:response regulator transcription factor n=1 Tax=Tropicimonas sp. S265A TaxID=3415134 RepID=UPI003C7BE9B6
MAKKVLLIEDEPNIIEAIKFILSREGWDVQAHSDGATALDAIARTKPDALVLDVMLPNRSGFEILRDLRAEPDTHGLPVLMLTAKGQKRDRELAESYGVTHFMTKPFSNQEVLERLRELTG